MNNGNSPLEMLTAFAIVFCAGVATAAALAAYKNHLQKEAPKGTCAKAQD